MDTQTDYLWKKRYEALYDVEPSVLYHLKRARFFDLLDKSAKAVAVFGGSAALWKLATRPDGAAWIAAAITVTSTLSLVFGYSERARRHAELAASFRQLEAEIISKGERDFSESDVFAWQAKIRATETAEPAALGALVVACQNELARAAGQNEKIVRLSWVKRMTMNFIDWNVAA